MTNEEFKTKTKKWLNHKLILAKKSNWYKQEKIRHIVQYTQNIFNTFLMYPNEYNAYQLAMQLRKHENLLMGLLPVPKNPTYHSAFNALAEILQHAEQLKPVK